MFEYFYNFMEFITKYSYGVIPLTAFVIGFIFPKFDNIYISVILYGCLIILFMLLLDILGIYNFSFI